MNTMLTSSNQYLRPEYLSPLPTTLDAKKSPLALLAQTCSAIGADSPNPKLISAAEKASLKSSHKHSSDGSREKTSPALSLTSINNNNNNNINAGVEIAPAPKLTASFKPYESCLTSSRDKTRSPEDRQQRVRTPLSSKGSAGGNTPALQPRCASNHSSSSQQRTSPHQRKSPSEKSVGRASPSRASPQSEPRQSGGSLHGSPSDSSKSEAHLAHFKAAGMPPTSSSAFLGGMPTVPPPPGFALPADLSGLIAAQHHAAALKASGALHPYLSYARLKAGDACRDPYCTGCSLGAHLLGYKPPGGGGGACPAGCAQCDHAKASPFGAPPLGHPAAAAAAAAYAHAQLAALAAASQLPYACSWVAGDSAYCGKRFASSDELLQHLRGHAAALGDAAGGGAPHPLLPRAYPTPPLSPLAPRFHPYGKPPAHMQQHAAQLPFALPPPHPSLAAYFPPYPLFGPRGLHP